MASATSTISPTATLNDFLSMAKAFLENPAFKNAEAFMSDFKQLSAKTQSQEETMMATRNELIRTREELDRSTERILRAHREETQKIVKDKDDLLTDYNRLQTELAQEKSRSEKLSGELRDLDSRLLEEKKQSQSLLDQIASLKQSKSKLEGDNTRANDMLRARNNELRDQKNKAKEQDKLRSSLADEKAALTIKLREQGAVTKRIEQIAPVLANDDVPSLSRSLQGLWQACFEVVNRCFQADIDIATLENSQSWSSLREHSAIPRDAPFPPSNTLPAKRIRSAALMACVAECLVQHIFTPSYLFFKDEDEEFRSFSYHLATNEAEKGKLLRRVLNDTCRDKQSAVMEGRRNSILHQVNACIQPLLGEKAAEPFLANLSKVLTDATKLWNSAQCMESYLEADVDVDTQTQWQWMELSWSGGQGTAYDLRTSKHEQLQDLDGSLVLFPRVFIVADSVDQPVFPGIVLPRSETRAAQEEWDAIRQSKPMLGRTPTNKSMRSRRATLNQTNGAPRAFLD